MSIITRHELAFSAAFFRRCFSSYSGKIRTHYEVLKLPTNCTEKDIKQAFTTLSKEYHPDVSKSENSHAEFVRLSEAYSTLVKPVSRADYDRTIGLGYQNIAYGNRPPEHYTFHAQHRQQYYSNDYYDVGNKSGPVRRAAEGKINVVALCVLAALAASAFQFYMIRVSILRSKQNSHERRLALEAMKRQSAGLTNEQRIQKMLVDDQR